MSRGICEQAGADGCWVADRKGGCFSDIDHFVPQRYKKLGWIVRWYINTPDNKIRDCRWEHEIKNANQEVTESIDLIPDDITMLDAITRAVDSGYFRFNPRNQQRYENIRDQIALSASQLEGAA